MADLWSDYTDMLITQFDTGAGKGQKISARDFLSDPLRYASQDGIGGLVDNMHEDLNDFIDNNIQAIGALKTQFEASLQKCDTATAQISQTIASRAKTGKVPVIRPVSVERNTPEEAISIIDSSPEVNAMIDKFLAGSNLIADFTKDIDGKKVGSWLFSGAKNYLVNVYLPYNEYKSLKDSKAEINTLFDVASRLLKKS
jgi:hypothetical protein